jgi:hypothetical protein
MSFLKNTSILEVEVQPLVVTEIYKKCYHVQNTSELVKVFQETLITTNRTPEFFVDWTKVKQNVDNIKIELSLWNSSARARLSKLLYERIRQCFLRDNCIQNTSSKACARRVKHIWCLAFAAAVRTLVESLII